MSISICNERATRYELRQAGENARKAKPLPSDGDQAQLEIIAEIIQAFALPQRPITSGPHAAHERAQKAKSCGTKMPSRRQNDEQKAINHATASGVTPNFHAAFKAADKDGSQHRLTTRPIK